MTHTPLDRRGKGGSRARRGGGPRLGRPRIATAKRLPFPFAVFFAAVLAAACSDSSIEFDKNDQRVAQMAEQTRKGVDSEAKRWESSSQISEAKDAAVRAKKDEAKICTNTPYPPFEFINPAGNLVGYDRDVMTAAGNAAGFSPVWVNAPFDKLFDMLDKGECDAIAAALSPTEERAQKYGLSSPYNPNHTIALWKKGKLGVSAPKDLKGKTIAVAEGSYAESYLRDNEYAKIVVERNSREALGSVFTGGADAAVGMEPELYYYAKLDGYSAQCESMTLPEEGNEAGLVFVSAKGAPIGSLISAGLQIIQTNGDMDNINAKWFGSVEKANGAPKTALEEAPTPQPGQESDGPALPR